MALPSSHPLIIELESLRSQLHTTQTAAHRSGLSLQSTRLELSLAASRIASLERSVGAQAAELEVLRGATLPPSTSPNGANGEAGPSKGALAELSLAHRRLSAKLDLTEQKLGSTLLELAGERHEVVRLSKAREEDRAVINELRRREGEWEEELSWERGEKRRAEEQKKLCDLALQEYRELVLSLDPSAVPPPIPSSGTLLDAAPSTRSDDISNLLLGQRGVHQLVRDYVNSLSTKDKESSELADKVQELESALATMTEQLQEETALRVSYMEERDRALRDDASAAKVVERYMAYTQKTHATIHLHLDNLRKRASATQSTLRGEIADLEARLKISEEQSTRLAGAMYELIESVSRETSGRRREVATRLRMVAEEEKRDRRVEVWLDRVRRARDGAEGAVLEADQLEVLVDEGLEAVLVEFPQGKGWRRRKQATSEDASVARVLLAEELVNTLVQDLQVEMGKRMELEKQRIEWITQDALGGVRPVVRPNVTEETLFDLEDEVKPVSPVPTPTPIPTPSPLPSPALAMTDLTSIFQPLENRYTPLQTRLHSLSHALASLRPATGPLAIILDNLHEALEDARVDTEIALADEERVYRGFEALLNVGKGEAVRSGDVLSDAKAYVEGKVGDGLGRLGERVGELEDDVASVKSRAVDDDWEGVELKSVSIPIPVPIPENGPNGLGKRGPIGIASMGRSFSASLVGAPRKVSMLAGGLYRPKHKSERVSTDDVE